MNADMKKLKRAAIEPARVFGKADFTNDRLPLRVIPWRGQEWYAPFGEPWMVLGGDCKVLAKAVERYDAVRGEVLQDAPFDRLMLDLTFFNKHTVVDLGEPEMFLTRNSSSEFAGFQTPIGVVPAVPVVYAERRFGSIIVCVSNLRLPHLTVADEAGSAVVVVSAIEGAEAMADAEADAA